MIPENWLLGYEFLRLAWWALLGILLIGFAIMDGFDMGIGALLPFVARTDTQKRVLINSIGPFWEGNQVWFILGGGAVFAAWPLLYAVAFSGFYFAMFLVLVGFILRPVGFDYRNKVADPRWRAVWDAAIFIGGAVPSLVFGVAFGNLFQGVPFRLDADLRSAYTGGFWALLNPFALFCGVVSVVMLATRIHGESPFKGYRVTAFTNEEEEAVGLASRCQWLLEDELKEKVGVEFSRGPIWEPYMVEDRNLITGQNPHSAQILADRLLKILV